MKLHVQKTPIGRLYILYEDAVLRASFNPILARGKTHVKNPYIEKELTEYFSCKRKKFTIKVKPEGTKFQLKVWSLLMKIPYGTTLTYGDLAKILGTSPRAVGRAVATNPVVLIIPCHRIVSKKGIGGYSGGLWRKHYLLNLEKSCSKNL